MFKQVNLEIVILWISIAIFYFLLGSWIPLTHDDWTWAGNYANQMIAENFQNLNGRYLGNFGVIFATRSDFFRLLTYPLLMILLIWLMSLFSRASNTEKTQGNKLILSIVFLGLLIVPSTIHKQTISWFSGFYNYIPALICSLTLLFISLKIILKQSSIRISENIALFFVAFFGQLFMENHSVFNTFTLIGFVIWYFILYKKININLIISSLLSILGFLIMFTNENYRKILLGESDYQSLQDDRGFIVKIVDTIFNLMPEYIFFDHIFLIILVGILFYNILIQNYETVGNTKCSKSFILVGLFALPFYKLFIYDQFNLYQLKEALYIGIINFLICLLFIVTISYISISFIKRRDTKYIITTLIFSLIIIAGPLLVVSPIGPRNFLAQHVFWVIIISILLPKVSGYKFSSRYLYIPIFTLMLIFLFVFHSISVSNNERIAQLKDDVDKNPKQEVYVVKKLPFEHLLQHSSPRNKFRDEEWLTSIGIDKDIKLKFVPYYD